MNEWLRSIIYASVFCALALSLTPEGRVKSAEKLICGIVILLVIFMPLFSFNYDSYASFTAKYTELGKELSESGRDKSRKLNRTLIEDELCAYILDKAKNSGIDIYDVSVKLAWDDEGYWYPVSACISGSFLSAEREKLGAIIEAELGVPEENQSWTEVEK